jgi:3-hydroxyacyl-[acyl-carrier-protein] dehydratase
MRYFMLDRITDFKKEEYAKAIKNITFSDDVLHDHFPDLPVFPGVLIVESMAQLAGFLIEISTNTTQLVRRAILAQINSAKFHFPAEPGDTVELLAEWSDCLEDAVRINATARVNTKKIAAANLTFVLKEIPFARVNEQRRELYKIWTRKCLVPIEIL